MFRRFFSNPKAKQFQPSKRIRDIIEESKIDPSDFTPKLLWDPKNPPKTIWERFNVIRNEDHMDYMDDKGRIVGTNSDDYILGSSENDTIEGSHGSDLVYGGDGNDRLYGDQRSTRRSNGIDTLYGGNGNDFIQGEIAYGERGDDDLYAPTLRNRDPDDTAGGYLNGGQGNDKLYGDSDVDTLTGGVGDDVLKGGGGGDIMTGGGGSDRFYVGNADSLGDQGGEPQKRDVITDFEQGDRIYIEALGMAGFDREDAVLEFNNRGVLEITVYDSIEDVSGVVAEVHGLDATQDPSDQISWHGNTAIELI